MVTKKSIVGIFTREHEDMYHWLVLYLLTISVVKDVRQVPVSNNFYDFRQEAEKCNFAILYHSKKRGRLNVTDVTDSLYDMELKHLNDTHGKEKVLVVIDDLEDSADNVKFDILNSQQSISALAKELFIFSTAEKALLGDAMASGYQNQSDLGNKLARMKTIIEDSSSGFLGRAGLGSWGGSSEPDLESGQRPGQRPGQRQWCKSKWIIIIGIIVVLVLLLIVLPIIMHH